MKICDLTQFYSPVSGGVKRYVQEKVAWMRRHAPGDTHLLVIPGKTDRMLEGPQTRIYEVASPMLSRTSRYRALLRLGAVRRILEREQPDLIESSDPYQMAWQCLKTGDDFGIPVIGFYHSHFPEAYLRSSLKFFGPVVTELTLDLARRYVEDLYNKFSRTVVPSEPLAAVLRKWDVRNTEVVELGVDTSIFRPFPNDSAETRKRLNVPQDRQVLLYVGRLAQEKNTQTLFKAFDVLNARLPGRYFLQIVGDGLQRPQLDALRKKTGAVGWLRYCADSTELAKLYRAADVFVHPGVQETFGLVTLESQASGTPVVGIRGSYMDRIIFNDQDHWAAGNDSEQLSSAIEEICGMDLKGLGLEAHQHATERYAWESVFGKLFALYTKIRVELGRFHLDDRD